MEKGIDSQTDAMQNLVHEAALIKAKATMIISCPACGTRYVVPETAIGVDGRMVRCAKCKHNWFQEPKPLELKETAKPAPQPSAAPPRTAPPPEASQPGQPASAPPKPRQRPDAASPSVDHWRTEDKPEVSGRAPIASQKPGAAQPSTDATVPRAAPPRSEEDQPAPPPPTEEANDPLADAGHAADDESFFEEPDTAFADDAYDGEEASFDYRPPFTRRRNSLKMWSIAAVLFALLASGTVVAVNFYGLPDWLPIQRPTFGIGKEDLAIDFPAQQQRKEVLETGEEIFRVRGSISNTGPTSVTVPRLLVVFRDAREKNVYSWIIEPSKRELAPGESLSVTEAITDIPPAAEAAEIGWSPN